MSTTPSSNITPTTSTSTPTQVAHGWRTTVRTIVQFIIGLAALAPVVAPVLFEELGVSETSAIAVGVLAVAGAITRVMALPAVNDFLTRFLPFLAPDSPSTPE